MECTYDYITHVTTLQLEDRGEPGSPISYSLVHSVSPTGGEEMFLFSDTDPARLRNAGQFEFIMEQLYFNPLATISAIAFIDCERPTLKQLQAPAEFLEQSVDTIIAPLGVWTCRRTDWWALRLIY